MCELLHTSLVLQECFVGDGWPSQMTGALLSDAQTIFRRRRHQLRGPARPNSSPGSPAPTIGLGTATGTKTIYAVAQLAMQVDRVTQILFRLPFPREIMAHVGPTRAPRDRTAPGGRCVSPWGRTANTSAEIPQDGVILTGGRKLRGTHIMQ